MPGNSKKAPVKTKRGLKKTKRRNASELNVDAVNHHLLCSPTYIGTIIMKSFKTMIIQTQNFSFVVSCGNHFFAVYCTPESFEIFDSLGFLKSKDCVSKHMIHFINSHMISRNLCVNHPVQHDNSKLCGYFVIYFIKLRDSGKTFDQIMKTFYKDKRKNNDLVMNVVNKRN